MQNGDNSNSVSACKSLHMPKKSIKEGLSPYCHRRQGRVCPLIPSALLAEDEGEDESASRKRGAENHRIAKTGSLGRAFR